VHVEGRVGDGVDVPAAGERLDGLVYLGRHHGHGRAARQQAGDLARRHSPAPDDEAPPAVDDQADRVQGGGDAHRRAPAKITWTVVVTDAPKAQVGRGPAQAGKG